MYFKKEKNQSLLFIMGIRMCTLNEKPMLKNFHYAIKRQLYSIIVKAHHLRQSNNLKEVMKIESLLSSILFEGISSINRDWVIINNEWL